MSSKDRNNPIPAYQQYGYTGGATSPAEQALINQQESDAAQNHLNNQYGGGEIVVPQPTQLGSSPGPNNGNTASLHAAKILSQGHANAEFDHLAGGATATPDDQDATSQSGGRKRRTYRKRRGGKSTKRRTRKLRTKGGKRKQRRKRRTRRLRTRGKRWGCFSGGVKNKFRRRRSRRRITRKYRK